MFECILVMSIHEKYEQIYGLKFILDMYIHCTGVKKEKKLYHFESVSNVRHRNIIDNIR